jgi:hypothetical protein
MLDEGVGYMPSAVQSRVWEWWTEFWDVWVPDFTRGEPYVVVVNGDATDGRHHGSVTQISQNLADQARIAKLIMGPIAEKCEGRLYWIRGTEAHVGPSGEDEEQLAHSLGAIPNEIGQYARYELWIRLGGKALVHLAHHIGVSGSLAYESSALSRELSESYVESGRWGYEPPDVIIRSHRHRNSEVRIQTKKGFCTVATTASWQLKTPFAFRVAGARQSTPQIGGTVVRCGDEDVYTRHFVRTIGRTPEVQA